MIKIYITTCAITVDICILQKIFGEQNYRSRGHLGGHLSLQMA